MPVGLRRPAARIHLPAERRLHPLPRAFRGAAPAAFKNRRLAAAPQPQPSRTAARIGAGAQDPRLFPDPGFARPCLAATWRSSSTTSPGPRSRISPSGISRAPKRSEASSSTSSSSSSPGVRPGVGPGLGGADRTPGASPAPVAGAAFMRASGSASRPIARSSSRTRIVHVRSPERS